MAIRTFVALVMTTALLSAQNTTATGQSKAAFEVVSVKPAPPGRTERFESYCAGGRRFVTRGTPLLWSIKWAYDLNDYQMSDGWPLWLNAFGTYDIEAEADGPVTETACKKMTQELFTERFKLRMHSQRKTIPVFELILVKNGPKLSAAGIVTINGAVKQAASEREAPPGWTMARFANYLASVRGVQRPVIDRTGLAGSYGFILSYSITDGDDRPDILTALPEQLGLRLRPTRAPVAIWAVDYVEKPSAN